MKAVFTILLQFLVVILPSTCFSQSIIAADESSIDYTYFGNNVYHPCITPEEYTIIERQCAENSLRFGNTNSQKKTTSTSLSWPLRMANGLNDCGYYFIAAYVDQDTVTGTIKDFNCGSNTYDGHHGTDIAVWPYGFYKMDNSYVEVVAAAPGTIIQKADGNFDRNCTKNNLTANSIIIQHADGSYALYWHMKKNSVTSKAVGQTVVAGEYLGGAGSSGSASGPHLHFEVWTGNTNTTYKDPYSGNCNTLNPSSWWAAQKTYTETAVIKVSTNTTDIVLPGCPSTETPNETDVFAIPFQGAGLPAGYAKFYIFLRDEVNGLVADCKILNPNQTTFAAWTSTSTANNKTGIRGFSKLLPTIPGTYTFKCTYNGVTCSKTFDITSTVGIPSFKELSKIEVSPNPCSSAITISGEGIIPGNYRVKLHNAIGQIVLELNEKINTTAFKRILPTEYLPAGIYFLSIESEKENLVRRISKQ